MSEILISVLVPIYKVEPYLQRCIDSVLTQDFQEWEMILVDDGSPDRCPEIADNAALRDARIKVIHKPNGGLISARKAGVMKAKGKYYMFLDSDDWLAPEALSVLFQKIEQGYDMVKGSAVRILPDGKTFPLERYEFEKGEINNNEDFLVKMYIGKIAPYLWGALYRGSLFDENIFNESIEKKISLGEDKVTNLIVGLKFKRVLYIEDLVYCYYYNPDSIMSTAIVSDSYGKRMEKYLHDRVFIHYPSLLDWQKAKLASYCFINCFTPGLGPAKDFATYYSYWEDDSLKQKIIECTPYKYLRFIRNKNIYFLYAWLYRGVYRVLKKQKIKRNILE